VSNLQEDTMSEEAKLTALELNRIAPMPECEHLSSCSEDTLRRYHGDKIIKLSPRRDGMRVRDALMIGAETTT